MFARVDPVSVVFLSTAHRLGWPIVMRGKRMLDICYRRQRRH